MRIVSEQSEDDIRRKYAHDSLVPELRELAANMLRIVRGTGKPHKLLGQLESCAAAIHEYCAAYGHLPHHGVFHQTLDCAAAQDEYRPWIKENSADQVRWAADGTTDREEAKRQIRNASLQIAASMLLDQRTQQSKAEQELHQGIKMLKLASRRPSD